MHQDINNDTSAITGGPPRIHAHERRSCGTSRARTYHTPTHHPLLTPASWLFRILRAFCKGVGSLAKRPAAIR